MIECKVRKRVLNASLWNTIIIETFGSSIEIKVLAKDLHLKIKLKIFTSKIITLKIDNLVNSDSLKSYLMPLN